MRRHYSFSIELQFLWTTLVLIAADCVLADVHQFRPSKGLHIRTSPHSIQTSFPNSNGHTISTRSTLYRHSDDDAVNEIICDLKYKVFQLFNRNRQHGKRQNNNDHQRSSTASIGFMLKTIQIIGGATDIPGEQQQEDDTHQYEDRQRYQQQQHHNNHVHDESIYPETGRERVHDMDPEIHHNSHISSSEVAEDTTSSSVHTDESSFVDTSETDTTSSVDDAVTTEDHRGDDVLASTTTTSTTTTSKPRGHRSGRAFVKSTRGDGSSSDGGDIRRPFLRRHAKALGQQLDQLKNKALMNLGSARSGSEGGSDGNIDLATGAKAATTASGSALTSNEQGKRTAAATTAAAQQLLSSPIVLGPSIAAVFGSKKNRAGCTSFLTLYAFSLLGSSVGFYLFLYFISIGYALGIVFPLLVALLNVLFDRSSHLSSGTILHAMLIVSWSVRSVTFFVWREYKSWPALHAKIVQVNKIRSPPPLIKALCWFVYSFLYICMMSPCWFRIERDIQMSQANSSIKVAERFLGKTATKLGLLLQLSGLILESVADWQKCHFKASTDPETGLSQRNRWCHVGVWKYSTHPNYAGEWFFWIGTFLGGLVAIDSNPIRFMLMAAGLIFISLVLRGATVYITEKHYEKYCDDENFTNFRQTHGILGPKFWRADYYLPLLRRLSEKEAHELPVNVTAVEEENLQEALS